MPKYKMWITDPNPDEIQIEVEYYISPAEPDVGCFSRWVEIETVTNVGTNNYLENLDDNDLQYIEDEILSLKSESEEIKADYQHDQINDDRMEHR